MTLFGVALARLEALQPRRWPLAVAA